MSSRRRFISQSLLLLAVTTSLALAEQEYFYLALAVLALLVGWHRTILQDRPLLGPLGARAIVVGSFLFLVYEYFQVSAISVVALSHFMILVCATKFLQRRTCRDDAQFFVLTFLLLVVAAVVSGNLLFPVTLAVFLSVGLDALVRFHLLLERTRVEQQARRFNWADNDRTGAIAERLPTTGITCIAMLTTTIVGVIIFVLCPRLAANSLFSPTGSTHIASSVTGFATTLNFATIGPIAESERPVMRVQIEIAGSPSGELPEGPYFRGAVLTRYRCEMPHSSTGWEWKRPGTSSGHVLVSRSAGDDGYIELLPGAAAIEDNARIMVQRYWLDPIGDNLNAFACYPALRVRSDSQPMEDMRKWVDDQILQLQHPLNRQLRYTVESLASMTGSMAKSLADERKNLLEPEPKVVLPDDKLPRAAEMLAITTPFKEGLGPLNDPDNRLAFAQRICDHLHSSEFGYTLTPPSVPRGTEPIGEFLLNRKKGHCEYFASAMTVLCQLNGIPARIVTGYAGGDYNPVGNFYIVRQKHAHSWVEVFIPGREWVTFDPTPSTGVRLPVHDSLLRIAARYLDYVQFQWANLVVSYDADQRRSLFEKFSAWLLRPTQNENTLLGAVMAFVRELFGWRLKLDWSERLIYWVFALLVVLLCSLLGYVLSVAVRWCWRQLCRLRARRAVGTGPAEIEFYARFCRQLALWGIERPTGQTPAEFAEELAKRYPLCAAAPDVVQAYYHVAFGGQPLAPERRERLNTFLARMSAFVEGPSIPGDPSSVTPTRGVQ